MTRKSKKMESFHDPRRLQARQVAAVYQEFDPAVMKMFQDGLENRQTEQEFKHQEELDLFHQQFRAELQLMRTPQARLIPPTGSA